MPGLDGYHLLEQIGAGRDGIAYRAERHDGVVVEVRVLGPARDDAARWPLLVKRLNVAAKLDHPAARRVLEIDLGHEPPFVVLESHKRSTFETWDDAHADLAKGRAIAFARAIASALAAAHRLGLAHGRLGPDTVQGDGPGTLKIDFTGLDAGDADASNRRPEFRAPEAIADAPPTPHGDVFSLGALIRWLLTGDASPSGDVWEPLDTLLRAMGSADPDERPTALEVERSLAALLAPREGANQELDWGSSPPSTQNELTGDFVSVSSSTTAEAPAPPVPAPFAALRLAGATNPVSSGAAGLRPAPTPSAGPAPDRLGRFRLIEKLGEGGMGEVYKALDEADGTIAAVKVLRRELALKPSAFQRFKKEARLLAEVKNPYVTNLLEVNEDGGVHYIVLEYVAGRSLDRDLDELGHLDEPAALAIGADVARGLMDAHRLGIVHRDVKPANILLVDTLPRPADSRFRRSGTGPRTIESAPRVKLSDFGLARHAEQSESHGITQAGVVVGTPTYMAPEQCSGAAIDARTDVYALGATLYHLVAGRPPFQADDWRGLIAKHMNEPPQPLQELRPETSEGFCRVVEKALTKAPAGRYVDASAMLVDLERLLRGEPTGLPAHPIPPESDPKRVLRFDFEWDLDASPRQLWPHVSNTDRLDRAIGFGAVRYTFKFDPVRGVRRFLEGRKAGMPEEGEEHPYEWVEGRRLGVFREYARGPFHWVISIVELTPRAGGGTKLAHRLKLVPRGRLIRFGSKWGIGTGLRKEFGKVYQRIDAAVTGKLGPVAIVDPFEATPSLDDTHRKRLDDRLATLAERGIAPAVIETLGEYLANSPGPELARIRPIELARRFGLPEEEVIAACLHGASAGLLVLLWDLLCPVCRIPSEVKETLRALTEHGHCEACHSDYVLDFANSVELIFQAHPQVRNVDVNTYCAAGPAHSRHVVAQVRVHPGERFELELDLSPGTYKLVGPQLGWSFDFQVRPRAPARRWDLSLSAGPVEGLSPVLGPDGQVLSLSNDSERELLVRVERTAPRDDALTAARASSLAVFRELFPAEVLAPGRLVSVSNVTLLLTALDQPTSLYEAIGDARAFAALHEQFRLIDGVVRSEGGAVVKTIGEGVLAAFSDADAAVRAGLQFSAALASGESTRGLRIGLCAHRGPAMATTLNDHLDYFGTTVYQATQALALARAGRFVITRAVASDPMVAARLGALGLPGTVLDGSEALAFGPLVAIASEPDLTISRTAVRP